MKTLAIDIGGTGVKALVLDESGAMLTERVRLETPRPATPDAVLGTIDALVTQLPAFDRISVGFPGVVIDGVVKTAVNLHEQWVDDTWPFAPAMPANCFRRVASLASPNDDEQLPGPLPAMIAVAHRE
jgi:predicted NBD/HSP70 family sugar kinase